MSEPDASAPRPGPDARPAPLSEAGAADPPPFSPAAVAELVDHLSSLAPPDPARFTEPTASAPPSPPPPPPSIAPIGSPPGAPAMTSPTPVDPPKFTDFASSTFRVVRKGYDPDEVRRLLEGIDRAVAAGTFAPATMDADRRAREIVAKAHDDAEALRREAQSAVDEARQQQAMQTWFGDPAGAPTAPAAPAPGADAVHQADEIIRAAQAQADAILREAQQSAEQRTAASTSTIDRARWDGAGEHLARVMQHAEAEAQAMVDEAQAAAATLRAEAEADRALAASELAAAQASAEEVRASAESHAALVLADAEPRARDRIAAVLDEAERELGRTRAALVAARGQLETINAATGELMEQIPASYALPSAESFVPGVADLPLTVDGTPPAVADPALGPLDVADHRSPGDDSVVDLSGADVTAVQIHAAEDATEDNADAAAPADEHGSSGEAGQTASPYGSLAEAVPPVPSYAPGPRSGRVAPLVTRRRGEPGHRVAAAVPTMRS